MVEQYSTISDAVEEVLFKEKGSKFFSYAFPVESENEVKEILLEIKKQHHNARHWCYAYRLGIDGAVYRVNDDGEPSNTAGKPIYGQILSNEITNVLVVVVRYFGGVKLGVGGLIKAYRISAQLALEESEIVKKTVTKKNKIVCTYAHVNTVMRLIKSNKVEVVSQLMETSCEFILAIEVAQYEKTVNTFKEVIELQVTTLD